MSLPVRIKTTKVQGTARFHVQLVYIYVLSLFFFTRIPLLHLLQLVKGALAGKSG
jgi:hypothetical protein